MNTFCYLHYSHFLAGAPTATGTERSNLHSLCWLSDWQCGYKSQNNWGQKFYYYLQTNPLLQQRGNDPSGLKVKGRTRIANTYRKISVCLFLWKKYSRKLCRILRHQNSREEEHYLGSWCGWKQSQPRLAERDTF